MKKGMMIICFIIIAIILIISIYFFLGQEKSNPQDNNQDQEMGLIPQDVQPDISNPSSAGNPHPKIIESHPSCCNHPYWHKLYRATSKDGLSWTSGNKVIVDHASVPSIIKKNDTYILYYVNGEIDNFDCSISNDGINFNYGDCKIYGFTGDKALDPSVVELEDKTYRLYFFAFDQRPGKYLEDHKIMSAVSKDGINWLQEEGIRFEHQGILDPVVIKVDNKWRMYSWYGADGPPEDATIVVSESNDGLSFTKVTEFKIGGGVPDAVKLDNNLYALYFCSNGINVATSSNGLSFSNKKTALNTGTGGIICDPAVIKTDEGWVMYYKVQNAN